MRDILIKDGDRYIMCDLDGLKLTYMHDDDPRYHNVAKLRDPYAYGALKRELEQILKYEGYESACEYLETIDCNKRYFIEGSSYMYRDMRSREEIGNYEKEASDKVWLMRCCYIADRKPVYEVSRPAMERILSTYNDIPKDGYTDWECGYWNGIMGALRWVLGDEKDFLDT